MKKQLFTILALVCLISPAFSQFYIRGNVGYNLPANSQQIGSEDTYSYNGTAEVDKTKGIYGSFGSGVSAHLAVGGTISGNLGYDVEFGYLLGKKYTGKSTYEYFGDVDRDKTTMYSRSFQFAPSLSFTAGTGSIQPYTRIGPVLAITKLTGENNSFDTYNNSTETMEIELTGGLSVGFKGALGVTFNADKNLQFFAEASFISLSYAPKEREITKATYNGTDVLESIPEEFRKVKLKDNVDRNQDSQELKDKYSMGSIGLQVGVKFSL